MFDHKSIAKAQNAALRSATLEAPVGNGAQGHGVAPAGKQQRVGHLLARFIDGIPGDARLRSVTPRSPTSLRTSPALILLAMWNPLVHSTAWRRERNGGKGMPLMAVPNGNIRPGGRRG